MLFDKFLPWVFTQNELTQGILERKSKPRTCFFASVHEVFSDTKWAMKDRNARADAVGRRWETAELGLQESWLVDLGVIVRARHSNTQKLDPRSISGLLRRMFSGRRCWACCLFFLVSDFWVGNTFLLCIYIYALYIYWLLVWRTFSKWGLLR